MAHVQKLKSGAARWILAHCTREMDGTLARENIHGERTPDNWCVTSDGMYRGFSYSGELSAAVQKLVENSEIWHEEVTGRKARSDAVRLVDWVITLPDNVPRDDRSQRLFFTSCADFLRERYGERAFAGGFVHMDETTPHMHAMVVPIDDEWKLNAKTVISRTDLRTFHQDLQDYLGDVFQRNGYDITPKVLLDQGDEKKDYSKLSQKDYKKAMDARKRLQDLEAEVSSAENVMKSKRSEISKLDSEIEDRKKKVEDFSGISLLAKAGRFAVSKEKKEVQDERSKLKEYEAKLVSDFQRREREREAQMQQTMERIRKQLEEEYETRFKAREEELRGKYEAAYSQRLRTAQRDFEERLKAQYEEDFQQSFNSARKLDSETIDRLEAENRKLRSMYPERAKQVPHGTYVSQLKIEQAKKKQNDDYGLDF